MKLDGGSQSFNIFNVLQLVCIVSNPSVSYFDTVHCTMVWSIGRLNIDGDSVFSPLGRLFVYKLYLVSIMTTVMGKGLGGIVGPTLVIFLNLMDWNGVSLIFVGLGVCFLVLYLKKN